MIISIICYVVIIYCPKLSVMFLIFKRKKSMLSSLKRVVGFTNIHTCIRYFIIISKGNLAYLVVGFESIWQLMG